MNSPRRWLESNELTAQERRVLGADVRRAPPPEVKRSVRAALSASLATAKAAAAAGGATSAKIGSAAWGSLSFLKALGVGFALSGVVGGALIAYPRHAPSVPTDPAPRASAGQVGPAPPRAGSEPATSAVPSAAPAVDGKVHRTTTARSPSAPSPAGSAFHESEGQRVAMARRLLRENQPARALEMLGALARDEPQGLLVQEREALALQALSALGACAEARNRAKIFAARYPTSPHASLVQAAVSRCADSSASD